MSRDDFREETKLLLARRIGFRCSNPNCRQLTSGPTTDPKSAASIGVASHITAASPGGRDTMPTCLLKNDGPRKTASGFVKTTQSSSTTTKTATRLMRFALGSVWRKLPLSSNWSSPPRSPLQRMGTPSFSASTRSVSIAQHSKTCSSRSGVPRRRSTRRWKTRSLLSTPVAFARETDPYWPRARASPSL